MTSWDTAASGYDRRKFYPVGSDKKGHSASYRVKVPTTVAGEIAKLIQSGLIDEYGSAQDFIRDAIVHRLQYLSSQIDQGDIERKLTMVMLRSNAQLMKQQREEFRDLMLTLGENCNFYLSAGRLEELRTYASEFLDQASNVPDAYREQYIGELERFLKLAQRSY